MTTIRFRIDQGSVTKSISTEEWEALEMAQDGEVKIYRLRPLLARFMIDDQGKQMEHAVAKKTLAKLPIEEFMTDVFAAFFDALKVTAVPNGTGRLSSSPSEAAPASESPAGSAS